MKPPRPPRVEERRTPQFAAELRERARAWIPSWGLADGERDFGRALLDVAARFSSEVAERLDRAGDKMQRGFLDFLAVRGEAARPARMPVVFKLADTAVDPVLATAPVQMQVDAAGASVVFESETDVRLLPGRMEVVAGVDVVADAIYLPPPGLHDLEPIEPLPTEWQLKSFAAAGAKKLQVDPEAGLAVDLVVEAEGRQYRLAAVDKEIVTIEPPLTAELPDRTVLRKVTVFAPFDGKTRNRQEHALYLGQLDLFDIETPSTIAVVGAQGLRQGVVWQYWGKVEGSEEVDWQPLTIAPDDQQQADALVLLKPKGKIEPREIGAVSSRFIRAFNTNVPTGQPPSQFDELSIRINARGCADPDHFPTGTDTRSPAAEGMANTTPLVLDELFFPLGREPRLYDAFYLACPEAFSKPGAQVQLQFEMSDPSFDSLGYLREGPFEHDIFAGVASDGHLHLLNLDTLGDLSRNASTPQRPPSPGPGGVVVAGPAVPLDPRPRYRAPMWMDRGDFVVAVAAGGTVWTWRQKTGAPEESGWESFGEVGPVSDPTQPITSLVHLRDGNTGPLFALREGKLFVRNPDVPDPSWTIVRDSRGNELGLELETIVPILQQESTVSRRVLPGRLNTGLVGVDAGQKLYEIKLSPRFEATVTKRLDDVAVDVLPAAVLAFDPGTTRLMVVAVGKEQADPTDRQLLAWQSGAAPNQEDRPLPGIGVVGHSVDVNVRNGALRFALCVEIPPAPTALVLWQPFEASPQVNAIPGKIGIAGGSPALLPTHVLVPARTSAILVAPLPTGTGIFDWKAQLGPPSTANPDLSWEYANGTGWWKLDPLVDETLNLQRGGTVTFTVPDDLRPMDWAGRVSFWIRARLVGGDYGKEVVTVKTVTDPTGVQTQTIDRSISGVPPSVLSLRIAYRLCKSVRPAFVLAQDSGSIRDQSDANRTRGAIVEAFVPLEVSIGRFLGVAASEATLATGRALFVGLNATPSGVPVNVLLLVDTESPHEAFAPMTIEALVADRLLPVVAEDTTRAIGESGLLSMAFALGPTPRELFGFENLTWLRLTPSGSEPASDWKPNLRGAYLNAVFASAAETITRELLGSSEGEPDLTVVLARPPVLRNTLELRVREPLGDEEREALRQGDPSRVLSAVDGLPGDWVLWQQVIDPGDEAPTARAYALDEASGEIRFGDGQHGAIPPIGRDSIVAFSYRRTELGNVPGADVPANSITARTAVSLVSPIETVEAVSAADQAAGGAPPESNERVVRFGTARLWNRKRALTARDFEDLALESSPDIVQARCFVVRGRVRLVVVMRGADPLPNAAEVRELRRLLLDAAPASLAAPTAFKITGPRLRRLRVVLVLRVATLDHAGEVARAVQRQIEALFDTATWALGAEPKDEDIARAIIDTPRLEGLASVELLEVRGGQAILPVLPVRADELVLLHEDPLRLAFKTVEVIS